MRQKRVILLYVSIVRRRALWAAWVMESASSRTMILNGGHGYFSLYPGGGFVSCMRAKSNTFSRTMEIPRSSEAFSSRTRDYNKTNPYSSLARARIVDVFPVPGGP